MGAPSVLGNPRFLQFAVDAEGFQEGDQIGSVSRSYVSLFQVLLIEMRIVFSAAKHEVDCLFESLDAAIVKIGSAFGDIAKRRSLEGAGVFGLVRDLEPAD